MFYKNNYTVHSDTLDGGGVGHCFATRSGGVSTLPETASMNTAVRMGDTPEAVAKNIALLASYAGLDGFPVIYGRQIHSDRILTVTPDDAGVSLEERECDGYVTDCAGIALLVRGADCLPILFRGEKPDGTPVIAAVHAGWRGTAARIAEKAVERMCGLGADPKSIRTAIGPAIKSCCFQVKEDFFEAVSESTGSDFAARHITKRDGEYYASLQDMNIEILEGAGVLRKNIDISPDCTAHMPELYHSHRATGGRRGAGGGIIGIVHDK